MAQPALLIRLRPWGPWRYGPGDGRNDEVDTLYRSDRLYSAVTIAMDQFGYMNEWLDATARSGAAPAAFTSLYPFQGEMLFAIPPATHWPPQTSQLASQSRTLLNKIRWGPAKFVPLSVIEALITGGTIAADQWVADPESQCLVRRERSIARPFRFAKRTSAAIDRQTWVSHHPNTLACVEFAADAGLWTACRFTDEAAQETWGERIRACFRVLADSGFGARRSIGWGQAEQPEFQAGSWPGILMPRLGRLPANGTENGAKYWMLSLFSPGVNDSVDWAGGQYSLALRNGRSANETAAGGRTRSARMIAEGSVLTANSDLTGVAVDCARDGASHPVYRSGYAVAIRLPEIAEPLDLQPAEEPQVEEAIELKPCAEPVTEHESISEPMVEPSAAEPAAEAESVKVVEEGIAAEPTFEPDAIPDAESAPSTENPAPGASEPGSEIDVAPDSEARANSESEPPTDEV